MVNGAEGEPASGKDRLLLRRLPHLVLDGALAAAAAVGADRVIVCVDRTNPAVLAAVTNAAAERRAGHETTVALDVAATPPRYVAGESSALVQWLNNGPAKPTDGPPTSERGVAGRPTLVQNAETLAHLAQIVSYGPDWFRQAGTTAEPGTMLLTVSGAVARPAIVETAIGTPIEQVLAGAGGVVGRPEALLVGGFFGTWVPFDQARFAPCSRAGLAPLGAQPGAGVVIVLPEGACGLAETARILAWYAAESAGQCGPCRYGLADLAAGAAALTSPSPGPGATGPPNHVAQLRRWSDQIEGRGACHHPDGRGGAAAQRPAGLRRRPGLPRAGLALPRRRRPAYPDRPRHPPQLEMTMPAYVLRVDPIACRGEGVCADLFPEGIRLDDWGYPIIEPGAVPAAHLTHARWAVDNCPALALELRARRPTGA